jgi:hypothetical protein
MTGRARLFAGLVEAVAAEAPDAIAGAVDQRKSPGRWAALIGFE